MYVVKGEGGENNKVIETNIKTLTTSAKAEITFPNVVRDLLMFAPSCNHRQKIYNSIVIKVIPINNSSMHPLGVCDDGSITFSLVPLAPVESARSLPAKSTRLILLT